MSRYNNSIVVQIGTEATGLNPASMPESLDQIVCGLKRSIERFGSQHLVESFIVSVATVAQHRDITPELRLILNELVAVAMDEAELFH